MATGSSGSDCSSSNRERSQLHAVGKTTRQEQEVTCFLQVADCVFVSVFMCQTQEEKNWFGTTIYVEVTSEGESKKTTKSHSSSSPQMGQKSDVVSCSYERLLGD